MLEFHVVEYYIAHKNDIGIDSLIDMNRFMMKTFKMVIKLSIVGSHFAKDK